MRVSDRGGRAAAPGGGPAKAVGCPKGSARDWSSRCQDGFFLSPLSHSRSAQGARSCQGSRSPVAYSKTQTRRPRCPAMSTSKTEVARPPAPDHPRRRPRLPRIPCAAQWPSLSTLRQLSGPIPSETRTRGQPLCSPPCVDISVATLSAPPTLTPPRWPALSRNIAQHPTLPLALPAQPLLLSPTRPRNSCLSPSRPYLGCRAIAHTPAGKARPQAQQRLSRTTSRQRS